MRRAILMMLLAVVSSNAVAEWVRVTGNETHTYYVNPSTIHKNVDMVNVWVLVDSMNGDTNERLHKQYLSSKEFIEIQCGNGRINILTVTEYSEHLGKGEAIMSHDYATPEWHSIPPDTIWGAVINIACGKQ